MNKEDIKKALECCSNPNAGSCKDCPYNDNDEFHCTYGEMCKDALNLINEQENEIERLKAEFKQLETNAEILARGVREFNHENYELTKKVKQAQVDTINTIIEYCKNPNHWNELKDCKLWGGKSDDLRVFLSGIFKESNDENTRTL